MRTMRTLMVLSTVVFCAACGSSSGELKAPSTKGSAAELAGTTWDSDVGTLIFVSETQFQFMPKAGSNERLPVPDKPLEGTYTVTEGMVSGLIDGIMPFAATWDGTELVIPGADYVKVN